MIMIIIVIHCFQHIKGAVYHIDDKRLAWCDDLEKVPHVYTREKIRVRLFSSDGPTNRGGEGQLVECWCYIFRKYTDSHLKEKRYESYSQTITPFLWYVECEFNWFS